MPKNPKLYYGKYKCRGISSSFTNDYNGLDILDNLKASTSRIFNQKSFPYKDHKFIFRTSKDKSSVKLYAYYNLP